MTRKDYIKIAEALNAGIKQYKRQNERRETDR